MKNIQLLLLLVLSTLIAQAQTLVNRDWSLVTGYPNVDYDFQTSCKDASNYLYTIGNSLNVGEAENFLITKYNEGGVIQWQQQYNGVSNRADFGTDIVCFGNYIYVTGVSYDTAQGVSSMTTLKLNAGNGNILWSKSYRGAYNGYNFATAICNDNAGNVFVTGTSQTATNDYAMVTLKYNPSGTLLWTNVYDSVGLYDGAGAIRYMNTGGDERIIIYGASGAATSSWAFETINIKDSSGITMAKGRFNNANALFAKATDIIKDASDNFCATGTVTTAANNTDIKVVKMSAYFGTVWSKVIDGGAGKNDEATAMKMDSKGNFIITGYATRADNTREAWLLKLDPSGNILWDRRRPCTVAGKDAQNKEVDVDKNGNIYTAGKVHNGSNFDYLTQAYDSSGTLKWEKIYTTDTTTDDEAQDISVDTLGGVTVSGRNKVGSVWRYTTVKYKQLEIDNSTVNDSSGKPTYIQNQVLVRFKPSILKLSFINNKELKYALLDSVIPDSIITKLSTKCGYDLHGTIVSKIFDDMNSASQKSIARNGDTILLHKFWASLRLNIISSSRSILDISKGIDTSQPFVLYASLNRVGFFDCSSNPNDPLYSNQLALDNTNNGINWCPDWNSNVFSQGSSNIKIGVYDSGINADHEDLQFNGNRKILGGKDYTPSTPINILQNSNSDGYGHGTAVMGIIGAQTGNGKGLVGVAGGNGNNNGCALYCNKIGQTSPISTENVYKALISDASSSGLGLHVINHSYHFGSDDQFLHDGFRFAATNGVVDICASGSNGSVGGNSKNYPSAYKTQWITKVGANDATGDWAAFSDFGPTVDLIAPGTNDLYKLLSNTNNTGYTTTINGNPANGNSFSAAYTSGAAGLVLSYVNGRGPAILAPEDVEWLLKLNTSTSNITSDDQHSGAGRLNIGNTLNHIVFPRYKVRHFSGTGATVTDATGVLRNRTVHFTYDYELSPYDTPAIVKSALSINPFRVDIWPVTLTLNYTIPTSETVIAGWALATQSDFWDKIRGNSLNADALDIDPAPFVNGYNRSSANLVGYIYHIIKDSKGNPADIWLPFDSSQIPSHKMTFSLYTIDSTISGIEDLKATNCLTAKAFPSPTSSSLTVEYHLPSETPVNISVLDLNGRLLAEQNISRQIMGNHSTNFDVGHFASGMYLVYIKTKEDVFKDKFIKE